jgi:hypothetical protein
MTYEQLSTNGVEVVYIRDIAAANEACTEIRFIATYLVKDLYTLVTQQCHSGTVQVMECV